MKLTTVLLLASCLHVSAAGFSQKISVRFESVEVRKALHQIERKSEVRFLYNQALMAGLGKVTFSASDMPVTAVLDKIFANSPVGYQILESGLVVLKNKGTTVKDVVVRGRVLDEMGEPIVGASVRVKGSTLGTSSGEDGAYELNVPDDAVLVFSYVGYREQEVQVQGRTEINTVLVQDVGGLDEVVVIGYGTQRKRDLTGSITSVDGEALAKMPNVNPVSSMQGMVPGLTIVNSGRAGSSPTVRIRGVNSTNNTNPLYVVDGIFQDNIDYLNPADIESIEVLRDPSSIAIFGLQGGNGVIIVTTKRAARGQTNISFQSNIGVQRVINRINVVDAAGFRSLYDQQLQNIGASPFDYTNYTANTDWQDQIFQDAIINNNNVTVTSSGEKSTTLLNLGYNLQEGVLRYDKYQRYVARLNHEIRFNENIKFGADVTGFFSSTDNPAAGLNNAIWAVPIVPIKAGEGLYYSMPNSIQRVQVGNPVANLDRNNRTSVNNSSRMVGSVFGEVKFLNNFTWRSSFYADLRTGFGRNYSPLPFRQINLGENGTPTDTTINQFVNTGVTQSQNETRRFQQDHLLTYTNSFGDHELTAVAGFNTLYFSNSNVSAGRTDTTLNVPRDPDYWYVGIINANNPLSTGGGGDQSAFLSYLGRVNYSYDGKYLVNASIRRDGSSKFSRDNRFGTFGSVGLGWVISQEDFFDGVNSFDFLKLRGSWGTVGAGQGLGSNIFRQMVNTGNNAVFGDYVYTAVEPNIFPDSSLTWEVVRGIDIGVDFRALSNKLSGEITFYDRTTRDIITSVTLPGRDILYRTNLGNITNRGVEISLGYSDNLSKDFSYRVSGNISYNHNRVESIGDNLQFQLLGNAGVNRTVTGQSIGYFWGLRQTGIYQTTADLDRTPSFVNSLPGDISYEDVNGDGIINEQDRTYLGTPFPLYNFGLNINLNYKNFDLLLQGQGVAGNTIYTERRTQTFAVLNYETNRLNAWNGPGTSNVEPILDITRANNYQFSSYFLEPGDYFRIRTAQVGYNFSTENFLGGVVRQLRLYVSGQNLATFTKATGYTPEVPIGSPTGAGADNGTYPVPAVYSFGINATF